MPGSNNSPRLEKLTEITAVTRDFATQTFPQANQSLQNPTEFAPAFYILWEPRHRKSYGDLFEGLTANSRISLLQIFALNSQPTAKSYAPKEAVVA